MREHDESWSVPLIAARAWSIDHVAGLLAESGRPRPRDRAQPRPIAALRSRLAYLSAAASQSARRVVRQPR